MNDSLDTMLSAADPASGLHQESIDSVLTIAAARASDRRIRRGRVLVPALVVGALFTTVGGAAAANGLFNWTYVFEPDISISRDWFDVNGAFLGSCESRLASGELPRDAHRVAADYLASVDIDAIVPDPEILAASLFAQGRIDDIGTLVPGAQPSDFELSHDGEPWDNPLFTDARFMQDAFISTLFAGMSDAVFFEHPELELDGVTASVETHCTTDPGSGE